MLSRRFLHFITEGCQASFIADIFQSFLLASYAAAGH